ncbi:MAG: hypothetical protein RLY82_793 [Pseudomonadota bacterium]
MKTTIEKTEQGLLIVVVLLLAAAILGPEVFQPIHQHDFADQRFFGYLPCAADVLSNLPFALWGLAGWVILPKAKLSRGMAALAALFFAGLIITAGASSWYHLQADNAGLAIDRLGMTVAFAGLLGLAAVERASIRAGAILSVLVLVFGLMSVWLWSNSGNVLPWLVLQFGGMALILWLATRQRVPTVSGASQASSTIRWGIVILIYAAAKVLELADHAVYDLTSQLISGHSLKHIVASFAAWPVISALRTQVILNNDSATNNINFGATRT